MPVGKQQSVAQNTRNLQAGREISVILLTVVRDGWKNNIYTIWGLNLIVFSENGVFLFSFVHGVLLISLEIMQKIYISRFILQGCNSIFRNILRVQCSLRKIKYHYLLIFWSESRGNTVKKAKGYLWLRKLKVDVLTVQRRAPRLSMLPLVRSFKLK